MTNFRFISSIVVILCLGLTSPAKSQDVLYSGSKGKKIGLSIYSDGVSDNDPDYVDSTYRLFKDYKTTKKESPSKFDFYYRLKVRVPSKFKSTTVDCAASPFLKALAEEWFSFRQAALISVSSNLWFEPTTGQNTDLLTDKAPILMFSEGAAAGILSPGHGCFLKLLVGKEFPPIRYEGNNGQNGKDVFQVNLDISTGTQLDAKFVSGALSLFTTAGAAVFPWAAAEVSKTADLFDKSISDAGTFSHESPINFVLKPRSTFFIKIPGASSQRLIEIYPYLSASVIAIQPDLTPQSVLSSSDLAFRSCKFSEIAAGTCSTKPLRIGLLQSDYIKLVQLPEKYQLPPSIFDPDSHPELAQQLCVALRHQLEEGLHLSTVDDMLVRWALTKESGLQDALYDPVKSAKFLEALKKKDPDATLDPVQRDCWNPGDKEVLGAVTAQKLKDH